MSENLHNTQIFNCIANNIKSYHTTDTNHKSRAYMHDPTVEEDILVISEAKVPHDMKILSRKMNKHKVKQDMINAFKEQLKNKTHGVMSNNIEDYKKEWLELSNDQRSNRINHYLKNCDYSESNVHKLRVLLIQGITGKLLEKSAIRYNSETAEITAIPAVQYNQGTDYFYFI